MTGLTGTLAIFNGFDYGSILWTCGDREESLGDKGMTTKAYWIRTPQVCSGKGPQKYRPKIEAKV
jgi:hypothetical protein